FPPLLPSIGWRFGLRCTGTAGVLRPLRKAAGGGVVREPEPVREEESPMSDSAYVRVPSSRFVVEHLPDGSAAVFDTSSNAAHSLNPAAVLAWESCDEPARVSDVARALRVAGAAVDETIARDTLTRLAEIGLIARTAAPAGARVMPRRAAV